MLQSLQVKNLALIEEEEVNFSEGLNILTGETGAGKSILIGSVNMALGEKVPKEMLREGADQAYVELVFHVDDPKVIEALQAMNIEPEDGDVILSRRITAQRTVAKINGESVPGSKLKEAASVLIDIHGQHEHQSLLNKRKHLEILDSYGHDELDGPKQLLADAYHKYKKLTEEYEKADLGQEEREKELSFLTYEVSEIEAANLIEDEDEELETEYKKIVNGKKILEAMGIAYQATGAEGASELIGRAVRELMSISNYDEKIEGMLAEATELDNLLSDLNRELSDYLSDADFNEERFYEVESRLDLINHLKSKFGDSITDILRACDDKKKRIETSKLIAIYLFVLLNSIVIYSMIAMWKFVDFSYLGVLISDIAAQVLIYAIYCMKAYKAKKSEEDLKFKREKEFGTLSNVLEAGANCRESVPTSGCVDTFMSDTDALG